MRLWETLKRGLGARSEGPTIWVDACSSGLADQFRVPAELIIVPVWSHRTEVVVWLLERGYRVVVEREGADSKLARHARHAWGEVVWKHGEATIRPQGLECRAPHGVRARRANLASAADIVESARALHRIDDERRRERQDHPRGQKR